MTQQIIKQPNGKYAIFSLVVDDFVLIDADQQDIVNELVGKYRIDMEKKVAEIILSLEKNENPYYQFTISFDEAVKRVVQNHGENAESLKWLFDK